MSDFICDRLQIELLAQVESHMITRDRMNILLAKCLKLFSQP
jgi:hypothetical protein